MSATLLTDLAAGTVALVEAAAITSRGRTLKVYDYEVASPDTLPALTIDGPTSFSRVGPDEAESQLGTFDWRLTYTLRLYVNLESMRDASDDTRAILGQLIAAFDDTRHLNVLQVLDASLSEGTREVTEDDNNRQQMVFTCSLEVWALVP